MFASDFESSYDAMQLVFQRRHRNGLTIGSNYVLAHTTWTQPSPNDVSVIERFDADFDVRHRFVFSANYEIPFGQSFTGAARQILAGWQINGVAYWQTGLAFNVTNSDRPRQHQRRQRSPEPGRRSQTSTNPRWRSGSTPRRSRRRPINTIGNAPRNVLHGPPQRRLDLSLFKDVALAARAKLQLRVEAYNVTNTPSFANPIAQLGAPGFGSITASATRFRGRCSSR